ncbi:MAG TPA: tetratricopeptide repeat protein [Vicinamibacteria bacterium]|nr:tetratricopeptide repeat protein [Vicinamibacteria bacterium]
MRSALLTSLALSLASSVLSDELEVETTWASLRAAGSSFVFGRLEGRFDGPDYRGRKLRVRRETTNEEHVIDVDQGLGYFRAALPTGTYEILAIEAVYIAPIRPMKPDRYPPVKQRYALKPSADDGFPTFPVVTEMPLYLGTLRSSVGRSGIVYEGHELEIIDEFVDAWEHMRFTHPRLVASLVEEGVAPERYFFLKPRSGSPALTAALDDPIDRARDYIAEGKFRQAIAWLQTQLPTTDDERSTFRLLIGEAFLGDRQYPAAIRELGEVLLGDPENWRALRLLARAHAQNGNAADAVGLYRALAEAVPNDAEASLHIGYHHALAGEAGLAAAAFESAFESNFDYLLHDLMPYALALKAATGRYEPPEAISGIVKPPSTMRSRRGSSGGFAILIDHQGRVVAAHLTRAAESWAPVVLMSVIRAKFTPAQLNGVAIPCLVILGAEDILEQTQ